MEADEQRAADEKKEKVWLWTSDRAHAQARERTSEERDCAYEVCGTRRRHARASECEREKESALALHWERYP